MADHKQKRMTKQKAAVYDVLCSTASHPTADWIYEQTRKKIPEISLGTVYRNLQSLCEDGKIMTLNYGKGQSRFDANPHPHYHFVCESCEKVYDFSLSGPRISGELLKAAPGEVRSYRFECYGLCNYCLEKKNML